MEPRNINYLDRELLEENEILFNQLQFTLEYLDLCLYYLNHYFNIIFFNDKRIKLHKFNINDLTEFLTNIEYRLQNLSEYDCPNTPKDQKNPEKVIYKTDPSTNDLIKKLIAENTNLKDQLNNFKKPRFEPDEVEMFHVENFQVPEVVSEPFVENKVLNFPLDGKVKIFDPKNLYDRYSGEDKPIFHANGWAGHGFKSTIEDFGKKKKFIDFHITQRIKLKKNQIVPVKKRTFSFLFNKPSNDAKKSSNNLENNVNTQKEVFIKDKSTTPVEKHNFL